jgi:hypothetical protein
MPVVAEEEVLILVLVGREELEVVGSALGILLH